MLRFLAKYRHQTSAIIIIAMITALTYLAIQSRNVRMSEYDNETYSGLAFGTTVKKTIYMDSVSDRQEVSDSIDELLKDLDERISYRNTSSEIAIFNKAYAVDGIITFSPDIKEYISRELEISNETEGAFSPCILPISLLWGIEDGYSKPPSRDELDEALLHIDPTDIEIVDDGVIFHNDGMKIDFGAVGKGIAADKVIDELSKRKVPGAIVSIGGTIAVYGDKGKGRPWHVGVQDPRGDEGKVLGVLAVTGGDVVSTSGDYEKYFEIGGKRYHHIFDPKTGYPADNGLISVTICTNDGFLSDALSTACFVMGLDKGLQYAEDKGVDAIFVTAEKKVYITKSLKNRFDIRNDEYELEKKR